MTQMPSLLNMNSIYIMLRHFLHTTFEILKNECFLGGTRNLVQIINDLLRPVYFWSFITIHSRNKSFVQVLKHKNQPILLKKKNTHQLRPFKWLLTRQATKNIEKFVMDSKISGKLIFEITTFCFIKLV